MATTRVATAGTFNSGDLISASDINNMPGGSIGRDILSVNSAGTTGIETSCTVTPTVGNAREVLIHVTANLQATGPTMAQLSIYEDGVQVQRKNFQIVATGTETPCSTFMVIEDPGPGGGAHQYDMATGVSGSSGETVTCVNNGTAGTLGASMILVIDNGPSY